ncbi:MAG: type II toxin-antitoxin system HicB family antitoxin [candidate division KSB1 bacterium]|nr:type II toxin-antitoxin system HicB family antitoxin [candidate division KSB1 bacterium]
MLLKYIQEAMRRAKYEIRSDDNSFYGEIPGFDGVYANAATLEECREELEEVLEEWIFFRISRNLSLPIVNGIELKIRKVA